MGAQKKAGARQGAGRSNLPPITVAKLEETGRLLEQLVDANQAMFVDRANGYRELHREKTSRGLSPQEAAQIAAMLAETDERDGITLAREVQESALRAYDQPEGREVLLAAGIAAGPAFLGAVRRIVALVELPNPEFEQACDEGTLEQVLDGNAATLQKLELSDAKKRASRAFAHYAKAAGFEPGEVWRLPVQAVWQALNRAMSGLADSQSSQLIDSAPSTEDSVGETSSTDSPG